MQPDKPISPDKGFLNPAYNNPISLPDESYSSISLEVFFTEESFFSA